MAKVSLIRLNRNKRVLKTIHIFFFKELNIENSETNEDINKMPSDSDEKLVSESVESSKSAVLEIRPVSSCESDSGIESLCDSGVHSNSCKLSLLKLSSTEEQPKELPSTYWPLDWRNKLCKCGDCMQLYATNKCLFLTNEKDMVHYYESQGMQSNTKVSHYEKGISELKKMNRIQQIEYISSNLI